MLTHVYIEWVPLLVVELEDSLICCRACRCLRFKALSVTSYIAVIHVEITSSQEHVKKNIFEHGCGKKK